uniref:melanoma-associated antigen B2-like n=1 Tax=Jaculus jaculus TaxID=51337 RepID=UPI001E1AFC37|nr:melanoma-associated antigen B2-like [Jaculus jaculus]
MDEALASMIPCHLLFYQLSCKLTFLVILIMPRGKKSKARARERREQNRVQQQKLKDAHPSAPEEGESPSPPHVSGGALPSSSIAGFHNTSQSPVHPTNDRIGITFRKSREVYQGKATSSARSSGSDASCEAPRYDVVKSKAQKLMDYMLSKYKMNQSLMIVVIVKRTLTNTIVEMVRVVNKSVRKHFPEILKRACQHLDMGFGLELKEVHPNANMFKLVSKRRFKDEMSDHSQLGLPARKILYSVLRVIYLNRCCAPEEKIWLLFNQLGIYDGIPHIIVGDARKILTQDLVQEKYLEYCQALTVILPRCQVLMPLGKHPGSINLFHTSLVPDLEIHSSKVKLTTTELTWITLSEHSQCQIRRLLKNSG